MIDIGQILIFYSLISTSIHSGIFFPSLVIQVSDELSSYLDRGKWEAKARVLAVDNPARNGTDAAASEVVAGTSTGNIRADDCEYEDIRVLAPQTAKSIWRTRTRGGLSLCF